MTSLLFKAFDYTEEDIKIPQGTILYRGIPQHVSDVFRDAPMYLAPEYIASQYGKTIQFETKKDLKLIDFRKLKNQMRLVITSLKHKNKKELEATFFLTIAYGLCSYQKQIDLFKKFMKDNIHQSQSPSDSQFILDRIAYMESYDLSKTPLNPFDPEGVRIAETYIDGIVVMILRELYSDLYDGYIAPQLFSPFHVGDLTHEEIVLFKPSKDILQITQAKIAKCTDVQTLLLNTYHQYSLKYSNFDRKILKQSGGHMIDKNFFFEHPQYSKARVKAQKIADKIEGFQKQKIVANFKLLGSPILPSGF